MYKKVTTIEEYSDAPIQAAREGSTTKKYAPCIRTDIPLMIRLLEFAREDASSDLDLHSLVTKMISMSEDGKVLTIADYEELLEDIPAKKTSR